MKSYVGSLPRWEDERAAQTGQPGFVGQVQQIAGPLLGLLLQPHLGEQAAMAVAPGVGLVDDLVHDSPSRFSSRLSSQRQTAQSRSPQ